LEKNIKFIKLIVNRVRADRNEIVLESSVLNYDILVIALGGSTNYFNTAGAIENSVPLSINLIRNQKDIIIITTTNDRFTSFISEEAICKSRRNILSRAAVITTFSRYVPHVKTKVFH
jgi:hypothetical protein